MFKCLQRDDNVASAWTTTIFLSIQRINTCSRPLVNTGHFYVLL